MNKKQENKHLAIAPYIAQGYEVVADYPTERRCELKKAWTAGRIIIFIILLLFYLVPGLIYAAYISGHRKQVLY